MRRKNDLQFQAQNRFRPQKYSQKKVVMHQPLKIIIQVQGNASVSPSVLHHKIGYKQISRQLDGPVYSLVLTTL